MIRFMQSKRGFALVFSLFLVLVLYTGMTVMMANLQTDLRMSKEAFRTTQSRFASQGAVNKLYSLLQNGANPLDYTSETPLEVDIGEFEKVKAWVVEDDDSGVFHLVSQLNGAGYNRVVTEKSEGEARTYLNVEGNLASAAPEDTAWVALPDPPKKVYNPDGDLIDCVEMKCEFFPNANSNGQLAATFTGTNNTSSGLDDGRAIYLWDEGSQTWTDVTPPSMNHVPTIAVSQMIFDLHSVSLGDERLYYWDHEFSLQSSLTYYDLQTRTWSDPIPGPLGGESILDGFAGPDNSFVAEVNVDGVTRGMKFSEGEWTELPPLPGNLELSEINTKGPDGELFATAADGRLFKLEQNGWSSLDVTFSPENLMAVDASGALVYHDQDSNLFRWDPEDDESQPLPEASGDIWGLTGGGTKENETGDDGFKTTATF